VTDAGCPSDDELSRALADGADARITAHVAGCARCRGVQEALRAAIAHARDLPVRLPEREQRDEVRAGLIAKAARETVGAAGPLRWMASAVVASAAAVLALWLGHPRHAPEAPRSHVVVVGGEGARYEVASPPPSEIIRLWDGRIDLDVQPLGPRDRVRVQVGDGEVEVRGTRFQVTARDDRLAGVEVTHGRVEVRRAGALAAVLGAGEAWRAPAPAAAPTLGPPSNAAEASVHELEPSRAERAHEPRSRRRAIDAGVERALRPTRQEVLYDDAWDALRARRFDAAAKGFARVLAESRSGPLADEAAFWGATAYARGGETEKARDAFEALLLAYPRSARRGEASAILGWLLVDAHHPEEAEPLFRAAAADPHANVRASAREGLDACAREGLRPSRGPTPSPP
jgi:TolA-binding protein